MRVALLLVVPLAFAAGLLLGRMLVTSRPPLPVDAKVVDSAPRERRASPLQVVTRQLAQEQRRQQELQSELDELRASHQRHQRQSLELKPGESPSWPCGLLASRVASSRDLGRTWRARVSRVVSVAHAVAWRVTHPRCRARDASPSSGVRVIRAPESRGRKSAVGANGQTRQAVAVRAPGTGRRSAPA